MKYKDYRVADFVKDEFFVEWTREPNTETNDFWKKYIVANPDQVSVINRAKHFINAIEYDDYQPLESFEYVEMFENILKRSKPEVSTIIKSNFKRRFLKVAAVLVLVVSAFLFYQLQPSSKVLIAEQVKPEVKKNPRGQKSTSILPDGTEVKINGESTLTIDVAFGKKYRIVELVGEAFFEVERDVTRPFIIKTRGVETRVLGTSFNVRSYESENNTEILVVTGEVSVTDHIGNSIVLNPHELLEYDHYENSITKSVSDNLKSHIGWKDGILIFENDPFNTVIDKIEKWYNVRIDVPKNFRIRGDYTGEYKNKSLKKVMEGWSYATNFTYTITNENLILIDL